MHEDTIRLQSEGGIKGAVKLCNRKTSVMMSLDYLHQKLLAIISLAARS